MTASVLLRPFGRITALLRLGAAFVGVSFVSASAQGVVVEDWSRTVTLLGANIYGAMVAVDANDAIYVTGHYPNYRIVTAKFAPDGTPLWQVDFSNPGTREHASWLTVDAFGDVVVAGYNVVGGSMTPNGFVTLKYDPAGNLLWSRVIQSSWGSLQRVATDGNGDVVVLGRTNGGVVTMKYSRTGTLLWTRSAVPSPFNQSQAGSLAIDASGNIFITGGLLGTMETFAYDAAGNLLWTRSTPAMGTGWDLALGPAGEVYVAGTASGLGVDHSLVAKFDAAGTLLWVHTYPGTGTRRLAVDGHGDIVLISGFNITGGYFDWITQKITPAGTVLWSTAYNQHQANDEVPYALTIGPDDEIYVTGQGGPGPTSGSVSYLRTVTVRYAKNGVQEWAGTSFTSLRGLGVARLSNNSIATVGESTFTLFHYAQSAVWRSVGGALGGTMGLPHLEGTGSPTGAASVSMDLSNGLPGAAAWLVGGITRVNLPFFGGLLVPAPDVVIGITLSPSGTLTVPFAWPAVLPPGFELSFQVWLADPVAPSGFAASNGLVGISG